eukprot:scaffold237866_cov19-Tisochrysis_lutea.AAC.1
MYILQVCTANWEVKETKALNTRFCVLASSSFGPPFRSMASIFQHAIAMARQQLYAGIYRSSDLDDRQVKGRGRSKIERVMCINYLQSLSSPRTGSDIAYPSQGTNFVQGT